MRILKIVYGNDEGGVFNCERQYIKELLKNGVVVNLVIIGKGNNRDCYLSLVEDSLCIDEFESSLTGGLLEKTKKILNIRRRSTEISSIVEKEFSNFHFDCIVFRRNYFMFIAYYI